jgi:hypothetical protein
MASKPQDASTQAASSQAAQTAASTQAANAATAQTNSNNEETSLFGNYNPATGTYSGGSESAALSPSSMDTTGLTGSYANEYNKQANTNANAAKDAVSTSIQQQDSRGMGQTPAGFSADQARQAYQTQAANNGANYATDFGAQHTEAVDQYNKANQLLATSQNQNQNSATANNASAAGTNTSLYGTASQQTPTALGTILGTAGTLAGAGATAYAGKGCWIASEIFGGWTEPRTVLVRGWIFGDFRNSKMGRIISDLYLKYGERTADSIRHHRSIRWIFTRICNLALRRAKKAA